MSEKITGTRKLPAILPITLLSLMTLSLIPTTHAYGGTTQLWQIALSGNCDNPDPAICGGGGGEFWVWAVLNSDGTGDATATGCGHTGGPVLSLTPPYGGAGHTNVNILSWTTSGTGTLVLLGEIDTFVGHGTPSSVTFSPECVATGIPLAPGHYSFNPAPGVNTQITVVHLT